MLFVFLFADLFVYECVLLFFVLKAAADRLPARYAWLALFYLLSTVGLWVLFFTTVQGKFEHPIMYLLLPFGLLIAFVWGRPALLRMAVAGAGAQ